MMAEQKPVRQEQLRGSYLDLQVGGRNTENGLNLEMREPMGPFSLRPQGLTVQS